MHLSLFVSVVEAGVMVSGIFPWHTLTPWYQHHFSLSHRLFEPYQTEYIVILQHTFKKATQKKIIVLVY